TAYSLDEDDQKALQQTQELLVDPSKRSEALTTQDAKKADEHTKSVGGAHSEEIYGLASKVFEKLVQKYNGDADKLREVIEKAKRDPSGFANSEFSPEELEALKTIGQKLGPAAPSKK